MSIIKIKDTLTEANRKKLSNYSDFEAHLLFHRGITSNNEGNSFLNPTYDTSTFPTELLKDIDRAVSRVLDAISKKEIICIYSDYDADGIPGAVVLSDFFEKIGYTDFIVYIPHRNKEGFGLNMSALDSIKDKGATLIITIDCGSTNVQEVEYANSLDMNVIITDHHEVNEILPPAYAIINPKQKDCEYTEKMLCGSGVIYKFVLHLIKKGNFEITQGWEKWLLDMVGVATISDMVPLLGENRVFAYYGLEVLKKTRRPGLLKLFSLRKINQKTLAPDDISFMITPQINAASRMGEPILAFNLLKAKTEEDADVFARELVKINNKRKVDVAQIVKEIKKHIEETKKDLPVVACGNPNWQPSLMGLAASKIAEEYFKPVFLWGRGEGTELKGSCRGYGDISVHDLLHRLGNDFFIQFGGHQAAGGFVIRTEKVSFLEEALASHMQEYQKNEKIYECDMNIHVNEITMPMVTSIEKLQPYGMSNPKPLFVIEGHVQDFRNFGSHQNHFEITLIQSTGQKIRAIAFYKTHESYKKIKINQTVSIVGHIEKNFFAGRHTIQIKLIDVL